MINWASSNRMAHQISFKKAQSLYKFDRMSLKVHQFYFFNSRGILSFFYTRNL